MGVVALMALMASMMAGPGRTGSCVPDRVPCQADAYGARQPRSATAASALRRMWLLLSMLAMTTAAMTAAAAASPAPSAAANDAQHSRALQARIAAIDTLGGVVVSVQGGVARLDGNVLDVRDIQRAQDVAAATPGIARVDNRIALDNDLGARFDGALRLMTGKLVKLVASLPLLLVASLIVMAAVWLGGVLSRRLHWLRLRTQNPYMDGLLRRVVQTVVVLVGILLALDLLGQTSLVGAVLGSAGVAGLALGFAFKDIAENYIAGILLSIRRPFAPGDHVKIDAYEGKIASLTSRATIMVTLDGNHLRLPNALVFKSVLLNYSINPQRRFDFGMAIDGTQSIRQAQALAVAAIVGVEGVLAAPAPSWTVVDNTPNGINLRFFGWVDQRESDLAKVRSEAMRMVKAAWAHAGVAAPRTVYHVVGSRERGATETPTPAAESLQAGDVDTSVNRDIDGQLASTRQVDAASNLLEPEPRQP